MAVSEKTVAEQIAGLTDCRKWNNKREIAFLPRIIQPEETILGLTSALFREHKWLVTVTDRRIIFLRQKLMEGIQDEIALTDLERVESRTGFLFGEILLLTTRGENLAIGSVMKKDVQLITSIISRQLQRI